MDARSDRAESAEPRHASILVQYVHLEVAVFLDDSYRVADDTAQRA
jgi:hypothetical protein